MKIIALDWGTKRIGVAVGDTESRIPFPRDFILSDDKSISAVEQLFHAENAQKIVLGIPRKLDGTEGDSATKVRSFAQQIRKKLGCEVDFVDERFSSTVAQRMIHEGALAKHKRQATLRHEVDSLAAAEILRNYFSQIK